MNLTKPYWPTFILGSFFSILGLLAILDHGKMPWHGVYIQDWVKYAQGGVGLILVFFSFKSKEREMILQICPTCQQTCPTKDAVSGKCPQCSVPLEPLEGFYKRHPELKDDKEQPDC